MFKGIQGDYIKINFIGTNGTKYAVKRYYEYINGKRRLGHVYIAVVLDNLKITTYVRISMNALKKYYKVDENIIALLR